MIDVRLVVLSSEGADVVASDHDEALCFNFSTVDEAALFARRLAAVLRTAEAVTLSIPINKFDVLEPLSAGIQSAQERFVSSY